MATIEERARDYAVHVTVDELNKEGLDAESFCGILHGYVKGATEQQKIDIEKACECFRQELKHFVRMLDCIKEGSGEIIDIEGSIESFRKAMEE